MVKALATGSPKPSRTHARAPRVSLGLCERQNFFTEELRTSLSRHPSGARLSPQPDHTEKGRCFRLLDAEKAPACG